MATELAYGKQGEDRQRQRTNDKMNGKLPSTQHNLPRGTTSGFDASAGDPTKDLFTEEHLGRKTRMNDFCGHHPSQVGHGRCCHDPPRW